VTILVPLVTLILGAGLGFLSSLLLERHRQANTVAAKVIDVYLELRKQLCEKVSELAGLRLDTPYTASSTSAYSAGIYAPSMSCDVHQASSLRTARLH
jgi:hypothetical protein